MLGFFLMAGGQSVCNVSPTVLNYLGHLPSNLCVQRAFAKCPLF